MNIRLIKETDKTEYLKMADDFYSTDAVYKKVPTGHFEKAFSELMRSNERIEAYILEMGENVAGYILLAKFYSQEAGGETVWFDEIYVKEEYRKKGLATKAMTEIMEKYKASSFRLEIEPENEGAIRLYERMGFKMIPYGEMAKFKDI